MKIFWAYINHRHLTKIPIGYNPHNPQLIFRFWSTKIHYPCSTPFTDRLIHILHTNNNFFDIASFNLIWFCFNVIKYLQFYTFVHSFIYLFHFLFKWDKTILDKNKWPAKWTRLSNKSKVWHCKISQGLT